MTTAFVRIDFVPKRLLTKPEAAQYCNIPVSRFGSVCSIRPVQITPRDCGYDKIDLDQWIDQHKHPGQLSEQDEIIKKLNEP
jgi:hypothetical protein